MERYRGARQLQALVRPRRVLLAAPVWHRPLQLDD